MKQSSLASARAAERSCGATGRRTRRLCARIRATEMPCETPPPPRGSALAGLLDELHRRHRDLAEGAVATYIPELARADPAWFGIAVATVDGELLQVGDHERPFTLQSLVKPFALGLALADRGREQVLQRVGVEPTGEGFSSIIRLDAATKRPHNPMVNAGAIAVTSLIAGADLTERLRRALEALARWAGRELPVDLPVFLSERATGHRNRAIAHLMRHFGTLEGEVEDALELYFQLCSVRVTCRDLALMGATLANGGVHPRSGARALDPGFVRDLLTVMFTCGMYDASGEWAYRVGLPAKSGVSGGVLAIVPGQLAVAVYSPPLDARGNSVRAWRVCEELSRRLGLHVFDAPAARAGLSGPNATLTPA